MFTSVHEVIRKLLKALEERLPGIIFVQQDDCIPDFFDVNLGAVEMKGCR